MINDNNSGSNPVKVTKVDSGWRISIEREKNATRVDRGWRVEKKGATEVDEGWRQKASAAHKATVVDAGWRKRIDEVLDPENVMEKATPNAFISLKDFQDAVAALPKLVSSKGNDYLVKEILSKEGGESVILMCSDSNGNDVAAKVFYEPVNSTGSSISARARVLEYMATEEGQKYTLAVVDFGLVEFGNSKYYFEITPYIAEGDISDDGQFSFNEIVEITRTLNEALHSIHQAGILHRDVKPQNIFKTETGEYKLGDFGVAKLAEKGRSSSTRHIVGTDLYTAPELRLGLTDSPVFMYDNKTDYYSLGVTLGSLFEGRLVYEEMDDSQILASVRRGKLPLRRVDPNREQLENLLNGLCRFDSNNRFGYEDVKHWLADHNYTGGMDDDEWPRAFEMLEGKFRDERSLFEGITKDEEHWNMGKRMLYGKYFENFFKSFKPKIANAAQTADELYRTNHDDKGLTVFLKGLFPAGPIVWKGQTFNSLSELGDTMVKTKKPLDYGVILQNHCVSHWLEHTEGIVAGEDTIQLVKRIEDLSVTEPKVACYWFGNSFAPQRKLQICNREVSTIDELLSALFSIPAAFYQLDGYQKLISRSDGADLYGFLYSLGYKELVELEWQHLESCDTFNKVTILMSMLDNIADKAGSDPSPVRKFYVNYGPIGIALYIKKLVTDNVYIPLDVDGKQILSSIYNYRVSASGSINDIFRSLNSLVEATDKLRRNLVENPHCILTGVYENKGIICSNLCGCFAFKIFDRYAPLGFNAWIETANGGVRK